MRIAIIGSGSAAFAAAIQAATKGADVTLVETGTIGGTCVNVGCVPSKIFIRAAYMAHAQRSHPFQGLGHVNPTLDRAALAEQQQNRVDELRQAKYLDILASNDRVQLIEGFASFKDPHTLKIVKSDHTEVEITADKILIATGSHTFIPDVPGLADSPYWTATEALQSQEQPESLIVIGSSVVASELAQAYARLGTQVTMLARERLFSQEDPVLGEGLQQAFEQESMRVLNHTVATQVAHAGDQFTITLPNDEVLTAQRLLVAPGRRANTPDLALENAGVEVDDTGHIIIDPFMQTNIEHIYAAGDCTNKPKFVYVAAAAGTRAAANMMGSRAALDLTIMPAVVFTDPQIATVGLNEVQAQAQGIEVESRLLPLENVPRALANFDTQGFIKLVAEKTSGKLVGAQVLAHEGGEVIQTLTVALHGNMTIKALSKMLFPYLTMVEGIKLCAQTFSKNVKELSCCADAGIDDEDDQPLEANEGKDDADQQDASCCMGSGEDHTSLFGRRKQPPPTDTSSSHACCQSGTT